MSNKETKQLFIFLLSLYEFVQASLEDDNKITASDFLTNPAEVFELTQEGYTGIAGANLIPLELSSMSDEEAKEIKELIISKFDISDQAAEMIYEDIMLHGFGLSRSFSRLSKLKAA